MSEYTVLIVDDIPANVMLVQVILKKEGYALLAADSGSKALQLAREHRPNIILLDIMMPDMDGYEVLRHLKSDPDTNHIPVIIMSALNDMPSILKGYKMGATEYVTKPFQREEITKRVANRFELYMIERYKQELEATLEAHDMLYSIISHDLRAPLGSLKMMNHSILQMIDQASIPPAAHEMLMAMNQTTEETFLLLDNLTKWSKVTQNKIQLYKQKTEINSLVESILSVYHPIAELKQVTLTLQSEDAEIRERVDSEMLKTILRNLLSGAIRYCQPDSAIRLSTRRNNETLFFLIQYTGPSKLSEKDKNRTTELGLQLCQAFIEQHQGQLEIDSSETKGTTIIRFTLKGEAMES